MSEVEVRTGAAQPLFAVPNVPLCSNAEGEERD